jgi:hypothetical protein
MDTRMEVFPFLMSFLSALMFMWGIQHLPLGASSEQTSDDCTGFTCLALYLVLTLVGFYLICTVFSLLVTIGCLVREKLTILDHIVLGIMFAGWVSIDRFLIQSSAGYHNLQTVVFGLLLVHTVPTAFVYWRHYFMKALPIAKTSSQLEKQ